MGHVEIRGMMVRKERDDAVAYGKIKGSLRILFFYFSFLKDFQYVTFAEESNAPRCE